MSAGDWIILGGLAALLVIGTRGATMPKPPPKKAAEPELPPAMAWMWRGV